MVINYKKTQKTILRVNPRVPLAEILPAICEKCEFDKETTVLLRDVQSLAPLDLSSSLNDYAIREVYARDTKGKYEIPFCIFGDFLWFKISTTNVCFTVPCFVHVFCTKSHTCWLYRTICFSCVSSLTISFRLLTVCKLYDLYQQSWKVSD